MPKISLWKIKIISQMMLFVKSLGEKVAEREDGCVRVSGNLLKSRDGSVLVVDLFLSLVQVFALVMNGQQGG